MTTPIVMIHGAWTYPRIWDNLYTYFEGLGYECHTPRLRHHDSFQRGGEIGRVGIQDYLTDLIEYVQSFKDKPIIIGWSLGGLLAQMLASKGLADLLILLAPVPPRGIPAISWRGLISSINYFRWGFWKQPFLPNRRQAKTLLMNGLSPRIQNNTYEQLVGESGRVISEILFWRLDRKRATAVDQSRVTCPVLIVAGKNDRLLPYRQLQKLAFLYREAHFVGTDDSHWMLTGPNWEKLAGMCVNWIENQLSTPHLA